MAAADLLHHYDYPIPERPRSWFAKQARQKPIRAAAEAAMIHKARRLLYRRFFEPLVLATDSEEDRRHDAELYWQLTERLAQHLVGTMMGARR